LMVTGYDDDVLSTKARVQKTSMSLLTGYLIPIWESSGDAKASNIESAFLRSGRSVQ
jgi:hypothetical protein